MENRPVGAELLQVDGQTWRSCSRFSQFCESSWKRL